MVIITHYKIFVKPLRLTILEAKLRLGPQMFEVLDLSEPFEGFRTCFVGAAEIASCVF